MKNFGKIAVVAALVGATALATASPSEARNGRNAAAAIGFGAGALVGAAVASSARGGYYAGYYDPGYAYEPAYADGYYAYEPAPVYVPAPRYYYVPRGGSSSECGGNPAQPNYRPC